MKKLFCISVGGMNKISHTFPKPILYKEDTPENRKKLIKEAKYSGDYSGDIFPLVDQDERDFVKGARHYLTMAIEGEHYEPSEMHLWVVEYEDYLDEMEHEILNPLRDIIDEGEFE